MIKSIPVQRWLELDWKVRTQLSKDLEVAKSKDAELFDGVIISDGRTQEDIDQSLTLEKLQEYTGSKKADVFELFKVAIQKAELIIYKKENNIKDDEEDEKLREEIETTTQANKMADISPQEQLEDDKKEEKKEEEQQPMSLEDSLKSMNFFKLKEYAKKNGVEIDQKTTKEEILEKLKIK